MEAVLRESAVALGYLKARCVATTPLAERLRRSYPTAADNVAFAYDLLGRRTQASFADASHTVAYVWDAAGRLTSTAAGGKTLAYQYDAAANEIGLTCFIFRFLIRRLVRRRLVGDAAGGLLKIAYAIALWRAFRKYEESPS